MKGRAQQIAWLLLLAFTAGSLAVGKEEGADHSLACRMKYGDISGRVCLHFVGNSDELTKALYSQHRKLAIIDGFPNPLAPYPELSESAQAFSTFIDRNFFSTGQRNDGPLFSVLRPLLRHYEEMDKELNEGNDRTKHNVQVALYEQFQWILKHPQVAQVPPLSKFLPFFAKQNHLNIYQSHANQIAARGVPVPVLRSRSKLFFTHWQLDSSLATAPPEIIAVSQKLSELTPLKSAAFTNWAGHFFDSPNNSIETVINQLVVGLRDRYVSKEPWLNQLKEKLRSGEITEAELAAHFAFHFPELLMQVHASDANMSGKALREYALTGYGSSKGKVTPASLSGDGLIDFDRALKKREAQGWNVRDPVNSRPVALALAYLRGESAVDPLPQPTLVAEHGQPALSAIPAAPKSLTAQFVEPARSAAEAPAPQVTVSFRSTPKSELEAWPTLTFEASHHDLSTAVDPLMLAHLDVAGSLRSARDQFRQAEVRDEQPALALVEAFLKEKDQKAESFPPVQEALKQLLALNAAKLKHIESLQTYSTDLLGQMKVGVTSLQSLKAALPSKEGATSETLQKIQTILETHKALTGVEKNAESVDRSLTELRAQILADKATLMKVVQLLGNPLSFPGVPRRPLLESLEALAKDGH